MTPSAVIAIDWSGALNAWAQRRGIQAVVCDRASGTVTVQGGRLRSELEDRLFALAGEPVVAGIDFSFSYPAWFLRRLGCADAPALWNVVAQEGEDWLLKGHPEFWGRHKGSGPPPGHSEGRGYRACEIAAAGAGRLPSSSFQVGGAGAVGTASLRGIPMLPRLRAAGWSVWPWDAPRLPMLLEIYPRVLTGPVVKSSAAARTLYLRRFPALAREAYAAAEASEDAFDALVSALVMREHAASFAGLQAARTEQERLEGAIWTPGLPWN